MERHYKENLHRTNQRKNINELMKIYRKKIKKIKNKNKNINELMIVTKL